MWELTEGAVLGAVDGAREINRGKVGTTVIEQIFFKRLLFIGGAFCGSIYIFEIFVLVL